ncbi:MAG TPA: glycosyltransferase family 2 protein [Alphaproteobacteria bacterium]|nr:glycosyltransferase family 2 protein [Alphaproteobacteria bacterium]
MADILVIIPCLNEAQHLEKLVRGILAANSDLPLRIVIADGGSTDGTLTIAQKLQGEFSSVKLLNNPKRYQSAGINLAVATYGLGADYLIRIDAHADYPTNYIRMLVEEEAAMRAASIAVTMDTVGKSGFQKAVAAAQNSALGNGGSAHRNVPNGGEWVDHGHHALMRIDAFRAVGGYDETFSHNEDAELDARLIAGGYKIWLTAKTKLTYYPRSSPMPLFKQYMSYGEGRARNMLKHGSRPKLRQLIPAFVAPAVLLALAAPMSPLAFWPAALWALICIIYGIKLTIKAEDLQLATSGFAAMIMHLGWSIGFWKGMFLIQRSAA